MKIHELAQGSPEWQAFRLNRHGSSEAAAMLGLSKKTRRTELLHIKHTGTPKEFSDWVQEKILDHGHKVEAMARPIIEEIIGEDLYPVTCSNEDEGGHLSASCDGLTMGYDTAFEHKQFNAELFASVGAGILPEEHMPQCQQILMITGASRVVFTVSDGTKENMAYMDVFPDQAWFDRLRAGWAQFDRDLAEYTPPAAVPVVAAAPVTALPSVFVQISGQIDVRDNFKIFEEELNRFLGETLIREPKTDQDFADLDQQIKAMKQAEDLLASAEAQMLAQIKSVDDAKRQKDMLAELLRTNRLVSEKLLKSEKERRRQEKIDATRQAWDTHIANLQREIEGVRLTVPMPDFATAIKGLKTLASIQDKLNTALANGKIEADQQAVDICEKLAWIDENAADYRALLADLQQLVAKPFDDFALTITARIDKHKQDEAARIEAERERIRQEEAAKLLAQQAQPAEQTPAATAAARTTAEPANSPSLTAPLQPTKPVDAPSPQAIRLKLDALLDQLTEAEHRQMIDFAGGLIQQRKAA